MSNRITRNRAWALVPALGLALTTALAFVGPVQSAGASTPKLYASPTGSGVTCGKTTPCTLSEALTKALSGTTIELAGGNYNEQPTISTSNLTIQGPSSGTPATLKKVNATANAMTISGNPETALLYVAPGTTGFVLTWVGINGSSANLPGNAEFTAAYFRDSSGTLDHVTTASITPPGGITGVQIGDNVRAGATASHTTNVTMTSDTIAGYNKNGITCDGVGVTCTIDKTTVTGAGATTATAQNGIQISRGAVGSITSSTVSGDNYTPSPQASGILIYDAGSGVVVSKNTLFGSDNNLFGWNDGSVAGSTSANLQFLKNSSTGSTAYDGMSLEDTTGAVVSQNKITGSGSSDGFGIGLYGAHSSSVVKNKITNSQFDGLYLGAGAVNATSTGNSITSNHVTNSAQVGIHADTPSASNTFTANSTKNNVGFDIQDQGTGNNWNNNHCTTHASSSPLGDC